MADANVNHPGQILGAGALDALWLEVFSGEVLTAFEISVGLRDTIRVRQVRGMKSMQFPATYRARTEYHVPGTEILGDYIDGNQVLITLDDMLISSVFVAEIEELKTHFDVRAPYATELGRAQALWYDRTVANVVVAAARTTSELFPGDGSGTVLKDGVDISASADFTASGADLIAGFNLAKQKMEEKAVPVDQMRPVAVVKPASWYLMANSDKALNRDYNGGEGSLRQPVLNTISGIQIRKSIAPLFGFNVTPFNSGTNATGIVQNAAGDYVSGTNAPAVSGLPLDGFPMPYNYPTKYQADQRTTVGLLWVEPAAAMLSLIGLSMETDRDVRRQGTLMLAKSAIGAGPLRVKCAVELSHASS
jgi:hypothetical protein